VITVCTLTLTTFATLLALVVIKSGTRNETLTRDGSSNETEPPQPAIVTTRVGDDRQGRRERAPRPQIYPGRSAMRPEGVSTSRECFLHELPDFYETPNVSPPIGSYVPRMEFRGGCPSFRVFFVCIEAHVS